MKPLQTKSLNVGVKRLCSRSTLQVYPPVIRSVHVRKRLQINAGNKTKGIQAYAWHKSKVGALDVKVHCKASGTVHLKQVRTRLGFGCPAKKNPTENLKPKQRIMVV